MRPGCTVFANACNSASAQPLLGDFVSFGWELFVKGAVVYIGTVGAIPTKFALGFAEAFYGALNGDANGDLFRAFFEAKRASVSNDPMHILYAIYGNPVQVPS